jgi:hypothetical protein
MGMGMPTGTGHYWGGDYYRNGYWPHVWYYPGFA